MTGCWNRVSNQAQTNHNLTMFSQIKLKEGKKVFHEKVAIVTGATYGIGFAIARRLAQDGAHVLLCSRKLENVEKALEQLKAEGLSISAVQCHVGNKEDRERLVATAIEIYGKIDILICNAAVNPFVGPIFDTTETMWEKVFQVNVTSTFFLIKLVAPHMENQGGGSIIICSSFIGYIPHPLIGPYSITKTALLGLTNILAQSLRFKNIRVNGLALGLINTGFSSVVLETPELSSLMAPLNCHRIGEPEECASVASFLCSEDASYINGENIAVNGGMRGRL